MRPAGDSMTPSLLSLLSRDLSTLWLLPEDPHRWAGRGCARGRGPGAWTRDLLAGSELAGPPGRVGCGPLPACPRPLPILSSACPPPGTRAQPRSAWKLLCSAPRDVGGGGLPANRGGTSRAGRGRRRGRSAAGARTCPARESRACGDREQRGGPGRRHLGLPGHVSRDGRCSFWKKRSVVTHLQWVFLLRIEGVIR